MIKEPITPEEFKIIYVLSSNSYNGTYEFTMSPKREDIFLINEPGAIVILLYLTGAGVREILNLKKWHFQKVSSIKLGVYFEETYLFAGREIYLHRPNILIKAIEKYISNFQEDDYLFPTYRIARRIYSVSERWFEPLKRKLTLQDFKRSKLLFMKQKGFKKEMIQSYLGFKTPAGLKKYVKSKE